MAGRQSYVYCFVPGCKNTSCTAPEKLFFPVPSAAEERRLWCSIVRRSQVSCKSNVHCCQDHFNVENDVQHYTAFMILKGTGVETPHLKIKKGVRPHIFHCQPDRDKMPIRPGGKKSWKLSPSLELEAGPSSKMLRAMLEGSGGAHQLHTTGSSASALDKAPIIKDEESHDWEPVEIKLESELILDENDETDYYLEASHHPGAAVEQSSVSPRTIGPHFVDCFSSTTEHAAITSQVAPFVMVKIKEELTDDGTPPADSYDSQDLPMASVSSVVPLEQIYIKTEDREDVHNSHGEAYQHVFAEDDKMVRDNDFFADDGNQDPLRASSALLEDNATFPIERITSKSKDACIGKKDTAKKLHRQHISTESNKMTEDNDSFAGDGKPDLFRAPSTSLKDSCTFPIERITIKTEDVCIGEYDTAKKPHRQQITPEMTEDNGMSDSTTDFLTYSEHGRNSTCKIATDYSNSSLKTQEETMGCDKVLRNVAMEGFGYPEFVLGREEGPITSPIVTANVKINVPETHIDEKLNLGPSEFKTESSVQECAPTMDYVFVDCSAVVGHETMTDSQNCLIDTRVKQESSIETVSSSSVPSTESSKTFVANLEPKRHSPSDKKVYSCNKCPAEFTTSSNLTRHLRSHSNIRAFSCNQCCSEFKTKSHLWRHLLTHSTEKAFSCNECSAKFKTASDVNRHSFIHSNVKAFSCNQCSAQFKTTSDFNRHLLTHSNERSFSCNQCSVQFKRNGDLKKHFLIHSNERAFSCDQCSLKFRTNSHLQRHLLTHSNVFPFSCNECSAQFRRNSDLKSHLLTHSNEKAFSCNQCSAKFKLNSYLKRHLLIHSTEFAFSCNQCSAQFKRKADLKKHLLTHSDEKAFSCNQCSAKFKRSFELKSHLLVHSDERAFSCTHCSSSYKSKNSLHVHLQKGPCISYNKRTCLTGTYLGSRETQ